MLHKEYFLFFQTVMNKNISEGFEKNPVKNYELSLITQRDNEAKSESCYIMHYIMGIEVQLKQLHFKIKL